MNFSDTRDVKYHLDRRPMGLPRIRIFALALTLGTGLFAAQTATAKSLFELDLQAAYGSKIAPAQNDLEVFTKLSYMVAPRIGIGLNKDGSTQFQLRGRFRLFQLKDVPSRSLVTQSDVSYDLFGGLRFLGNTSSFEIYGGLMFNSFPYAASQFTVNFERVSIPFVGIAYNLIPLRGEFHDIGIGAFAEYFFSGTGDNNSVASGYAFGGEFLIDLSFAGVPFAVIFNTKYTNYTLGTLSQTETTFGIGFRFFLINTGYSDKGQTRFFYGGANRR